MEKDRGVQPRVLHFGIMCDGPVFSRFAYRVITELIKSNYAKPILLIVNQYALQKKEYSRNFIQFDNLLYELYYRAFTPEGFKKIELTQKLFSMVPTIYCKYEVRDKYSQYFSKPDIERIQSYNLDFILRFGFKIIRGEILESARYGVWSFHHADEQKYRGGAPGFREIYNNDKNTCGSLQKLTDCLDGGIILKKKCFQTNKLSIKKNFEQLLDNSIQWPVEVCEDIVKGNADYFRSSPVNTKVPIQKIPTNLEMIVVFFKIIHNYLNSVID